MLGEQRQKGLEASRRVADRVNHCEKIQGGSTQTGRELNKTVKFFVAPKQMGDLRKMDVLWYMLMDSVHHRGQFSVYLRMADGKVPSIYGPSADEPWM